MEDADAPSSPIQLRQLQTQLRAAQLQLERAHHQLVGHQQPNLPPLENGQLNAFRLTNVDPRLLAETLEKFLGPERLRLVPDVENKVLLTYSTDEVAPQISELIKVLDSSPTTTSVISEENVEAPATQSLLLRVFWLAEGQPSEDGGSDPRVYLPQSVIDAVRQLGLQSQMLVAQSTTSLAVNARNHFCDFHISFPAAVDGEILRFEGHGEMTFNARPQIELNLTIASPATPIELAEQSPLQSVISRSSAPRTTHINTMQPPASLSSSKSSKPRASSPNKRESPITAMQRIAGARLRKKQLLKK